MYVDVHVCTCTYMYGRTDSTVNRGMPGYSVTWFKRSDDGLQSIILLGT